MSLDFDRFHEEINGNTVSITISYQHPLIKLAKSLPWNNLLVTILPDLQRTNKGFVKTLFQNSQLSTNNIRFCKGHR